VTMPPTMPSTSQRAGCQFSSVQHSPELEPLYLVHLEKILAKGGLVLRDHLDASDIRALKDREEIESALCATGWPEDFCK
jgi:hypothetical protein